MVVLKRLAGQLSFRANHRNGLIKPKRSSAVKYGSRSKIFKGFRISHHTEVILMPVFISNQVIQHHHLVEGFLHTKDTKLFAAIKVMLINRHMVRLFLRLHHIPCRD
ncbi:hypothetical protein SDC9_189807 [bioreactor metagenome]|uniref:Uncharacterized protein n=1 Tax=bioreactor metagenome TaxID=1076179 RepID=A0A645HT78_9ZZZZ